MSSVIDDDIDGIVQTLTDVLPLTQGRRVLVTGATGMVGRYLVLTLLRYAETLSADLAPPVVIASMRSAEKARRAFGPRLESAHLHAVYGDVTEITSEAVGPVDYIFHAASPASPSAFRDDPVGIIKANVEGTWRLLDIARDHDAVLCLISTMEVYGEIASADLVVHATEDSYGAVDSLALRSAYPESKRMAENSCVAYHHQFGVKAVIARLTHTYGPGMELDDGRVQAEFMRKAIEGDPIVMLSDGTSRRTYTHIADATSATVRVALTGEHDASAYNIANVDAEISIRELAEHILVAAGREASELRIEPSSAGNPTWNRATGRVLVDTTRARGLGWQPRHSPAAGLARTIAHHREEIAQ